MDQNLAEDEAETLRYLLFTTRPGGFFPSLMDAKVQGVNRFKSQLNRFREVMEKENLLSPEVLETINMLDQELEEQMREKVVQEESVHRPGVYQWHTAFNKGKDTGEVRHTLNIAPEELQNYDIIHINGCGADADLLPKVKQALRGSSTKVIFNLDYAFENWQSGFPRVQGFYQTVMQADFIFAVEPGQQALLNYLIHHVLKPPRKKVSVPIIPHPCDVQGLHAAYVPHEERMDKIIVCFHRYDKHVYIPSAITWNLEAYHPTLPSKVIKVPVFMAGVGGDFVVPLDLFDGWICYKNWGFYVYELSHATIGMEYYGIHSHSRFPEECACLGVPCVGNTNSYSVVRLHPLLAHGMLDFAGMRRSLARLMGDKEFYNHCADLAWERVQELDHEPSKMRLLFEMNKWEQAK